jgi:carbonic anhydrase
VPNTTPHFAKNVLFACIDDRLAQPDFGYIKEIGGAFCPALAGGALAIVNEATRAIALAQITIAYQINQITDIYLQSHTDCGAYRLAGIHFESHEAEIERLYTDLRQAENYVREALIAAGADANKIKIHLRVVDPAGKLLPNPLVATSATA